MSKSKADPIVLDAHAILVFLGREPGWETVSDVLTSGRPHMTLINLGEVAYIVERTHGPSAAGEIWENLRSSNRPGGVPIVWVEVDDALVRRAASLKSAGGLSYADCFAAAAAAQLSCSVLTGNPEFRMAEKAGVAVKWLSE